MGVPVTKETAVSLSRATRDVILRRNVSDEIKQTRLDICYECPAWDGRRCKECGCHMKTKASLASSECPLKKWGRYTSDIRE